MNYKTFKNRKELINLFTYKPIYFQKAGFTLAEVLITLGIIGVVAAMTIPTLIAEHQKKVTVSRLKKDYAIITQAVRLAENEYGTGFDMTDILTSTSWSPSNSEMVFEKYLAPSLKINFKYTADECKKLVISHPQSDPTATYTDPNAACYNLMNATSISFWAGKMSSDKNYILPIYIFPNPNKKVKFFGKDVFAFAIVNGENGLEVKTVVAYRYPDITREELIEKCNAPTGRVVGSDGYATSPVTYCTELIRHDGWVINGDYPIKF